MWLVLTKDLENDIPPMGVGTKVDDCKGGREKIVTVEGLQQEYTRDEQLVPLWALLCKLLQNKRDTDIDRETINGMGFGNLRDVILASKWRKGVKAYIARRY